MKYDDIKMRLYIVLRLISVNNFFVYIVMLRIQKKRKKFKTKNENIAVDSNGDNFIFLTALFNFVYN